jgi:hypothetical protein
VTSSSQRTRAGSPPPSSISMAPNVMLGTTVPSTVHIGDMPRESSAGSGSTSRTARSGPEALVNAATTASVGDLPNADVVSALCSPGTSTPWTSVSSRSERASASLA